MQGTLEGPLTYEECKKILETFQNDKAPGEDGFTVEFYNYFFDLLGNDLIASFDGANEKGELSISQRRGIMNELPVIGYPCYAQTTQGSPGGKHCKSVEGKCMAKSCFPSPKKKDFGDRLTLFRRYCIANGLGQC